MRSIRYVGKNTGGHFLPGDVFAEHGRPVEVSDDLAAELCARTVDGVPQWATAATSKSKPAIAAVAAEES